MKKTKFDCSQYQTWDFKHEEIRATDAVFERVFGAGNRDPKDWRPHVPEFEHQHRTAFCLTFSYLNVLETLMKSKNKIVNFSDRWTGVKARTSHVGNTFSRVLDAARKYGLVAEQDCSWKEEWKKNPRTYWKQINDLSDVKKNVTTVKGISHSWVGTSLRELKNALADTPLWIGVGLSSNWENKVVYRPAKYGAYHGIMLAYIDDKYKYIFDSLGRPLKKLALNYPILYAKSPKDLPDGWADSNVVTMVDKPKLSQIYNEQLCREPDKNAEGFLGLKEDYVRAEVGKSEERKWVIKIIEAARKLKIVKPDDLLGVLPAKK